MSKEALAKMVLLEAKGSTVWKRVGLANTAGYMEI